MADRDDADTMNACPACRTADSQAGAWTPDRHCRACRVRAAVRATREEREEIFLATPPHDLAHLVADVWAAMSLLHLKGREQMVREQTTWALGCGEV